MSINGLISDCHVGIRPVIGEVLGASMQSSDYFFEFTCASGFKTTTGTKRPTINAPYSLDVNDDTDDKHPCRWLWWTKNRCLEYNPYFPGANACCCSGYLESIDLQPDLSAGITQNCQAATGGACGGGVWSDSSFQACYDPVNPATHLVGKFDKEIVSPAFAASWDFNTNYPTATYTETYQASNVSTCSGPAFNNSNLGLSTYQKRVAQIRSPDVWEILSFNDQKAIKIMNLRAGSSTYESPAYINAYNIAGTASKYLTNPATANASGGHGLFRYFYAFAAVEFAYKKGSFPQTTQTCENAQLWSDAMPAAFMAISDAAPIFSFQTDGLICTGANGDGATDLTKAIAEIDIDYASYGKQQLADTGAIFADPIATDSFEEQVEAVNTALLQATMRDNLACKDWRKEVFDDLYLVSEWANQYDKDWSAPAVAIAAFPAAGNLKLMGPVRLRGDWYDIRALNGSGTATSARPPSLARASTTQTGIDSIEYYDATFGNYTLQVHSTIYDMSTSSYDFTPLYQSGGFVAGQQYKIRIVGTTDFTLIGAASNTVGVTFTATGVGTGNGYATQTTVNTEVRDAFYRLTQSVYFRSKIAGWDFCGNNNVRTARYSWLFNRSLGSVANPADQVIESLGSGSTDAQPFWCTNGVPQSEVVVEPPGLCISVDCDPDLGGVVAYKSTANILVSRYVHQRTLSGNTGSCCKIVDYTSVNEPSCPYEESVICFARFINRSYYWDTSTVPYSMKSTSSHPIDTASICCEFPTVTQLHCDQCEPNFTAEIGECDWPFITDPGCPDVMYASQLGCGQWPGQKGPTACTGGDKWVASATLGLQVLNPGSPGFFGPYLCEDVYPLTSAGHVFALGHGSNEGAVGFFFPEAATLQSTTCCSVDVRYDQQLGSEWRARAWLSFPAITITPDSTIC